MWGEKREAAGMRMLHDRLVEVAILNGAESLASPVLLETRSRLGLSSICLATHRPLERHTIPPAYCLHEASGLLTKRLSLTPDGYAQTLERPIDRSLAEG